MGENTTLTDRRCDELKETCGVVQIGGRPSEIKPSVRWRRWMRLSGVHWVEGRRAVNIAGGSRKIAVRWNKYGTQKWFKIRGTLEWEVALVKEQE